MVAINPSTVSKAYRELELEGLVEGRPGVGTFVVRTLADESLGAPIRLRRDSLVGSQKHARQGSTTGASLPSSKPPSMRIAMR